MDDVTIASGRMIGRTCYLEPLRPDDVAWYLDLARSAAIGGRWRLSGTVALPAAAEAGLERDNLALWLVRSNRDGRRVGVVNAWNPSFVHRRVDFGIALCEPGLPFVAADSIMIAFDEIFDRWSFNKICMSVASDVLPSIASVAKWLRPEGVLVGELYRRGARRDAHLFAMFRSDWELRSDKVRRWRSGGGSVEPRV